MTQPSNPPKSRSSGRLDKVRLRAYFQLFDRLDLFDELSADLP